MWQIGLKFAQSLGNGLTVKIHGFALSPKESCWGTSTPARDPRDVETIERLQQQIQELGLQQLWPDTPAEEAETEPNVWDDESVDVNPFGGGKHRYVNHLYQPRRNDHVEDRDDRYHDDPVRSLGLKI
ncbi:hypothetical protein Tco_1493642 [Tanacetum coccineum]